MGSCKHDTPNEEYEKIDLQWEFSASAITPTTALVMPMLPEDCEYSLSDDQVKVCLTETKPDDTTPIKVENLIYGDYIFGMMYANNTFPRFFDNLKPNTTYYEVVNAEIIFYNSNGDRCIYSDYYFNGYSFTTPKSGDYSGLINEIKYNIYFYSAGKAYIYISMPYGLRWVKDPELRVSTSPDMKNFKSYCLDENYGRFDSVYIEFPESGRYYLEIVGGLEYMDIYNWNGEELGIRIPDYLDVLI